MASDLRMEYEANSTVDYGDVRYALRGVEEDDISVSSPVTSGAPEAGVSVERDDVGRRVFVTVAGHDGEFTKTSEEAIHGAIADIDGVRERLVHEGGYEPDE